MKNKQDRKVEGNNLGKKGKNKKLHKLGLGSDLDYFGAQLWINLNARTYTHVHTHRANTTSVIVSDGQSLFNLVVIL